MNLNELAEKAHEIAVLLVEDAKTDSDYIYTREKVDASLKQICGDDFTPWEDRYK